MTAFAAARNMFKVVLLLGGFVILCTGLGWLVDGFRLGSIFFGFSFLMAATVYWYAPRIILNSLQAEELPLEENPQLHSTADRLARSAGVDRPRLYVIPDGHPRALSVGRGAGSSAIAVTEGLLLMAKPAELEGILAHEISHARFRDVNLQTPVVLVAGLLVESSRIGGFLERAMLFVLAPIAASIVHVLLSPKREFAADKEAANLCQTPHGIADGLIHLEQAQELVSFKASPVTEPLYIVNPFAAEGIANLFSTHPSIGERVQQLRALDPEWKNKRRAA